MNQTTAQITAMEEQASTITVATTVLNGTTTYSNSFASSLFADNSGSTVSSTTTTETPTVKTNDTSSTNTTITVNTPAAADDTLAANSIQMTTPSTITSSNPCSNDNPNWEEGTLPCLNSTTDYNIFDGAFTTTATDATTVDDDAEFNSTNTTNSQVKDLPSSYSCYIKSTATAVASESNNSTTKNTSSTTSSTNDEETAIYFRFNYEIYTLPNQTTAQLTHILSEFEKKLGYGVAGAVGLVDCPFVDDEEDGLELRQRRIYKRRSLLRSLESFEFSEVSIEPLDVIDTSLCEYTHSDFLLVLPLLLCCSFTYCRIVKTQKLLVLNMYH